MKDHMRFVTVFCAACTSIIFAGCSFFMPPPEHERASSSEPTGCEALAMIDNAQDGDDQILIQQGRGGYIYSFADTVGTTIMPGTDTFVPSRGGVDGDFALRFKGKLADQGETYAGIGFSLMEPMGPYDAAQYKGIAFTAKKGKGSTAAIRVKIPDVNTEPEAKVCKECYNDFGISLILTDEWTRYEVAFSDLKQEAGWGDPQPNSLDVKQLYGIQWQVATRGAKFDIWIDDVTFIGCD